jgi:hypothetical protein
MLCPIFGGLVKLLNIVLVFVSTNCFAQLAETAQPSVSARVLICDQWQWIGNNATTWGCLTVPRAALVAQGQKTDQVIASLQEQINKLEARIKKLEGP